MSTGSESSEQTKGGEATPPPSDPTPAWEFKYGGWHVDIGQMQLSVIPCQYRDSPTKFIVYVGRHELDETYRSLEEAKRVAVRKAEKAVRAMSRDLKALRKGMV